MLGVLVTGCGGGVSLGRVFAADEVGPCPGGRELDARETRAAANVMSR